MLHLQLMLVCKYKVYLSRIEPGTLHTESRYSTTELLRNLGAVDPIVILKAL